MNRIIGITFLSVVLIVCFLGCSVKKTESSNYKGVGGADTSKKITMTNRLVKGGRITSGYGWRPDPFHSNRIQNHKGLDIAAPLGKPIHSAMDGQVIFAGRKGGYGLLVTIKSGYEEIKYGHCSSLIVSKGQYVTKGDTIALVGSTGRSTGPHLHFEITKSGRNIDPIAWLTTQKDSNVLAGINIKEIKGNTKTARKVVMLPPKPVALASAGTVVRRPLQPSAIRNNDVNNPVRMPERTRPASGPGEIKISTRFLNPSDTCEIVVLVDGREKSRDSVHCGGQYYALLDTTVPAEAGRRLISTETKTCDSDSNCEVRNVQNYVDVEAGRAVQVAYVSHF